MFGQVKLLHDGIETLVIIYCSCSIYFLLGKCTLGTILWTGLKQLINYLTMVGQFRLK